MPDTPGTRLKNARLARGFSIEDITATTKMRPNIIVALEADDYTGFPSMTHARNFLSLYGKHLKVDVTDGLNNLATPAKIGIENYQYLNVERSENTGYRTERRLRSVSRAGDQAPRIFGILIAVVVFLFFAVYLGINLRRLNLASTPSGEETSGTESTETPLTSAPTPAMQAAGTPTPIATPFYAPIEGNRQIIKKARPTPF